MSYVITFIVGLVLGVWLDFIYDEAIDAFFSESSE